MTRTKKKSSSPKTEKPSVVHAAWAAFHESNRVDDLQELLNQGWKSVYQLVDEIGGPVSTINSRLRSHPAFEKKLFRVRLGTGPIREVTFFRPKLKG
jgi:hypothetical protein